ncbi:MAG: hypothetical protein JRI50_03625 [Deltaproteobacteria bacterium]|nr:hypothetical protein [Deltaproteobacteria bacterium]
MALEPRRDAIAGQGRLAYLGINRKKACGTAILSICLVTFLLYWLAKTGADPDLWGYMAFGRLFWETGKFPYQDVFSYVPTLETWVYHEWLTGVIFFPLYETFGATGLQVLKYGLGLATAGLIYLSAVRRGATPAAAAFMLFLISGFFSLGYSPVRAQVFTFFFFALSIYLLETARLTRRWRGLWLLVLIQIPWCNLHGGFVSGLGLLGLYTLGEALSRRPWWPYLGILLLSGLATLINPYGLEYWHYIIYAVTMPRPEITEWASVIKGYQKDIISLGELVYILSIVVFGALLIIWARWREITAGLVVGVSLYLGLKHIRHLSLFWIVLGAYLPVLVSAFFERLKTIPWIKAGHERLDWRVLILLALGLIAFNSYRFIHHQPLNLTIPSQPEQPDGTKIKMYYPVGAIDYIQRHHLSGNILTWFEWGEYLFWTLYPQCLVALDGRYETVYPEAVSLEYFDFLNGRPNWQQFLSHYPPDMIVIRVTSKIHDLLQKHTEWRRVYSDSGCALFLPRGSSSPLSDTPPTHNR